MPGVVLFLKPAPPPRARVHTSTPPHLRPPQVPAEAGPAAEPAAAAAGPPAVAAESLWVVRKSAAGAAEGDDEPLFRVHRICRSSEHEAVGAAAAAGLAPRTLFDPAACLLAQEYIAQPQTFSAHEVCAGRLGGLGGGLGGGLVLTGAHTHTSTK